MSVRWGRADIIHDRGQVRISVPSPEGREIVLAIFQPGEVFGQVASYYHERLKLSAPARAYLASRGRDSDELIVRFQLGFADRTLGLRLPDKNRQEGERLRSRLTQLGLWRQSGHEHFNGCVVVPFHECGPHGPNIVSLYGRRVQRGELRHLYPPGPHRGLFNPECFRDSNEVILCEAVFDALTFWLNGFRNVWPQG